MTELRVQQRYALERMGKALDRMQGACSLSAKKQAAKWAIAWAHLSEANGALQDSTQPHAVTLITVLEKYIQNTLKAD